MALASSQQLLLGNLPDVLRGIGFGLALTSLSTYLIFKTEVSLRLPAVLKIIKAILILSSLSLINQGIHELTEAGWFPVTEYPFSEDELIKASLNLLVGLKGKISLVQAFVLALYASSTKPWLASLAKRTKEGPAASHHHPLDR